MTDKITQKYLNSQFEVTGSFYRFTDFPKYLFRNVLDIKYKGNDPKAEKKALLVMMNPGSCIPLGTVPIYNRMCRDYKNDQFIQAIPYNVQYTVMKMMLLFSCTHCRVINAFDLKEASSKTFMRMKQKFETNKSQYPISIFNASRKKELKFYTKGYDIVILAIGTNSGLRSITKEAKNYFEGSHFKIYGKKVYGKELYYHPSRKSHKKVEQVIKKWNL